MQADDLRRPLVEVLESAIATLDNRQAALFNQRQARFQAACTSASLTTVADIVEKAEKNDKEFVLSSSCEKLRMFKDSDLRDCLCLICTYLKLGNESAIRTQLYIRIDMVFR